MALLLTDAPVSYPYFEPFRISRGAASVANTVLVILSRDGIVGRGEADGVGYAGETVETMRAEIAQVRAAAEAGELTRQSLQTLLPTGGARNALDCAFWDLEAKQQGISAARLAGFEALRPLKTTITIGIDTPARMAAKAAAFGPGALIKIKLGDRGDLERVEAIRAAAPTAGLIVDANQAWQFADLADLAPRLADLGVTLIEQPVPAKDDEALRGYRGPVPLCADEACDDRSSLPGLAGKYEFINIKLDKSGGLTEGLALARAARAAGFKLMVGCMSGTSLAMAPAFLVGQLCEVVDLDAPLFLQQDVPDGMRYEGNLLHPYSERLWG
ncbi:MAG TPA: N-acetyl-D-Glu racemase DgcA [Aliidongia sp.]|uniref:N-acetyl-D-Glu racemase DgcA n=1 Tax=Aliidongia sp. TaxID=1914230 RepID=UPI002DDD67E9|nr:N-acetyl-D-Glu racemase DgcA [Aliidongia sp.]HEV2676071.1 N-acetyl-D-Glu racemase DgcA [Aliidongia sp.]